MCGGGSDRCSPILGGPVKRRPLGCVHVLQAGPLAAQVLHSHTPCRTPHTASAPTPCLVAGLGYGLPLVRQAAWRDVALTSIRSTLPHLAASMSGVRCSMDMTRAASALGPLSMAAVLNFNKKRRQHHRSPHRGFPGLQKANIQLSAHDKSSHKSMIAPERMQGGSPVVTLAR